MFIAIPCMCSIHGSRRSLRFHRLITSPAPTKRCRRVSRSGRCHSWESLEGMDMRQFAMPKYHVLVANWRTARHFAWGPASRCHATWASEHLGTCHPHCTRICSSHTTGDTKNKPGTTKRSACGTKQGT